MKLKTPNKQDKYRCEFFAKTIAHIASNLAFKVDLLQQYNQFTDSAYNIRGIIENAEFNNNQTETVDGRPNRRSPLVIPHLNKLMLVWKHLSVLNQKLLKNKKYLYGIRL